MKGGATSCRMQIDPIHMGKYKKVYIISDLTYQQRRQPRSKRKSAKNTRSENYDRGAGAIGTASEDWPFLRAKQGFTDGTRERNRGRQNFLLQQHLWQMAAYIP